MGGIKVPGYFTPGTVNGFVTEARWVKGTYVAVNTVADRDAIPFGCRVDGTRVYVATENREYRWLNKAWEPLPNSFFDAPTDGKIYARQNGAWVEVVVDASHIEEEIQNLYSELNSKVDLSEYQQFQEDIDSKLENYVTKEEIVNYTKLIIVNTLPAEGELNTIYVVTVDTHYELYIWYNNQFVCIGSTFVDLSDYYTKSEVDNIINTKIENYVTNESLDEELSAYVKQSEIENYVTTSELNEKLSTKQDKLVSGVNIKTVGGQDILGEGDIPIEATSVSTEAVVNALEDGFGESSSDFLTLDCNF